ncbi:hypothetical protein Ocin01_14037 [Orchesella cincta]|uniref:Protein ABHD18 n=1 Tax=Orchesella cincta TaxID=48709 RepID=A0A1D2MI11_ORCCI|nr:hypothetical protein Ocin01_14037 [Orchesella cincta]
MASVSRLDQVYRSIVLSKFFSKGWGNPDNLKKLFLFRKLISNRELCQNLVDQHHEIIIDKIEFEDSGDIKLVNGHFQSPLAKHLPGILPEVVETAHFQMVLPHKWTTPDRPIVIQMAGTGDHHYWRRRNLLARPLLKEHGIASIILENPFYGFRKPKEQRRSNLLNVSDLFIMGGCLILEAMALLRWCERENYGPFCLHGISMGGHMASLAATNWPKPISLVPCLSWSTASGVFTKGVMAGAIDWKSLETQFVEDNVYRDELSKMLEPDDTDKAYIAGKDFVIQYASKSSKNSVSVNNNSLLQSIITFLKDRGLMKMVENVASALPAAKIDFLGAKDIQQWINNASVQSASSSENRTKIQQEALQFMIGIMDECTHLKNFCVPVDPELIIVVAARNDAYIPREGTVPLDALWPNCEIRYVDGGHITAYLMHQGLFRKTIAEAIDRYRSKYNLDGSPKNPKLVNDHLSREENSQSRPNDLHHGTMRQPPIRPPPPVSPSPM